MPDLLTNLFLITPLFAPPVLLALWVFGLRRYIRRKGRTVAYAIVWAWSMWADWTIAWEIGRSERKLPFSVIAFAGIHVLILAEFILEVTI